MLEDDGALLLSFAHLKKHGCSGDDPPHATFPLMG
jgi:hypothetical protein